MDRPSPSNRSRYLAPMQAEQINGGSRSDWKGAEDPERSHRKLFAFYQKNVTNPERGSSNVSSTNENFYLWDLRLRGQHARA